VYVYTNSRVLDQKVMFTDEAATEWYKQSVVSEDSDFDGPANFFDDYDNISDFDTLGTDMDGVSTDNENIEGQLEEHSGQQMQGLGIGEDGRDLQEWAVRNINGPHFEAPRKCKQSLYAANSVGGTGSLNTNHILHGGQEVENEIEVPNEELQDTGTSSTTLGKTVASEERPVPNNDAPPTNSASPFHNECPI
jgi:hypothetical protein